MPVVLAVKVSKRLSAVQIDVEFASEGLATALFGPSGSGKTSIVNMIAGLLKPDAGRIVVGETIFFDHDRRISVPAHKRRIGYVFQKARLFPHFSVRQNLDYGRWARGLTRRPQEEQKIVEMLDIGRLLPRRPLNLSGGEKQRVAIGRALWSQPSLLLLDEPLASLDEKRKQEILPYLERLRELSIPIVYVSHSPAEVERMAHTVIGLDGGRVADITTINHKIELIDE